MNFKMAISSLFLGLGLIAPAVMLAQPEGEKKPTEKTVEAVAAKLLRTDSPTPYVHRLTLYDHAGQAIDPADADAKPYSPKMTCGKCHPYGEIAKGWHFNHVAEATKRRSDGATEGSADVSSAPGNASTAPGSTGFQPVRDLNGSARPTHSIDRPGEPWIYADARLGVQIPLSLRGWPGTYFPAQIGLTAWQFTLHFGRHLCGGGFADPAEVANGAQPPSAVTNGSVATEEQPRAAVTNGSVATEEQPRAAVTNGSVATEEQPRAAVTNGSVATEEQPRAAVLHFAAASDVEKKRWAISGGLEIDCMMCHATMASGYDAGEVERQVERQNLRWSATAAMGLGLIRGDAKSVSNDYDPENPAPPDRVDLQLPKIQYEKSRFDGDNRVLFEIARKPPNERCTFCHATRHVEHNATHPRFVEPDVHLSSGLSCADCHRNGIDHATQRGIEDRRLPELLQKWSERDTGPRLIMGPTNEESQLTAEIASRATPASFSCAGCHSTITPHDPQVSARLGAPIPAHAGIPPLHFEKLTCTACHAGPMPEYNTKPVQTALAHGLGVSTKERKDDAPPTIFEPVFRRDMRISEAAGGHPIAPTRTMWPAFWAFTKADNSSLETFDPVPLDQLLAAARALPKMKGESFEQISALLNSDQIETVLTALQKKAKQGEQPAYIVGDRVYSLHPDTGTITHRSGEHARQPYAWPIAHEVRPAGRALGVAGCSDCHANSSVFITGRTLTAVPAHDSPIPDERIADLTGINVGLMNLWSRLFAFRTAGKVFLAAAIALTALVLVRWLGGQLAPSLPPNSANPGARSRWRFFAFVLATIGAAIQGFSSLIPNPFEHWPLLVHSAANPIFIVGIAAWAVLWCRASFGRASLRDWATCLTLCAGLGVMTTMLLAMLPLFSTDAMRELFAWHKYFGIAVLVGLGAVILLSSTMRTATRAAPTT